MSWQRTRCTLLGVVALLGGALAAPPSLARPPEEPDGFVARHAERLGLDAETRDAIQDIAEATAARSDELERTARAARDRLREELSRPDAARDAVLATAGEVDRAMAALHRSRLEAILEIHALLTPTQREELVRIRSEERPWRRSGGCAADLDASCPDAAPGAAQLRCLADHFDGLSRGCRATLERLRDAPRERPLGPREGPAQGAGPD